MPALALKGGYYVARSVIASAQRCANLYPEKNPEDAEQPFTMYLTPGLTQLGVAPDLSAWRGLWLASNGALYGVNGPTVYFIDTTFRLFPLGSITAATTPVGMADNGGALIIVDGSVSGWCVDITTPANTFAPISDPNFLGGTSVSYLDTFFVLNVPGSNEWYSSLSNVTFGELTSSGAFDPTYVAAKTGTPDPISAIIMMHRELWIYGTQRDTEVWYNAGNAAFPFAIASGVYIEHGCVAPYSICKHDLITFWLSADKDGQCTVYKGTNYAAARISTPAIAAALSKYTTVSDAVGMTYKQQDHVFYLLTFPSANATWVYDVSEGIWHERFWLDPDGGENRHRANCIAYAGPNYGGAVVVGDWQNGALYSFDLNNYTDNGNPIVRRRGFPHLVSDGRKVSYPAFRADMETGNWAPNATLTIYLRWSDNRGRTWGNPLAQVSPAGVDAGTLFQPQWRQLGMARDRVFELFWSDAVPTALQGAWLDPPPVVAGS